MRSERRLRGGSVGRLGLLPALTGGGHGLLSQLHWNNRCLETDAAHTLNGTKRATFINLVLSIIVGGNSLQTGRELTSAPKDLNELPSASNPRTAMSDIRRRIRCPHRSEPRFSRIPVGLIGLIIAIVLWGTAYKLSLYHQHPTPFMRVPVAKLWLENRSDYVVPLRTTKGIANDWTQLHALAASMQPDLTLVSVPCCLDEFRVKERPTAGFPTRSRAPPPF